MEQLVEETRQLIATVKDHENKIGTINSDAWLQEEEQRKTTFITQLNFLLGTQAITKLEYSGIIEMLASPDSENHFMAKKIVEKKIADSQWHIIHMNI